MAANRDKAMWMTCVPETPSFLAKAFNVLRVTPYCVSLARNLNSKFPFGAGFLLFDGRVVDVNSGFVISVTSHLPLVFTAYPCESGH